MKTNETGHYKNVVSLKALKVFAEGLGAAYSPQKETLKLENLVSLVEEATALHNSVKDQINTVSLCVDQRQLVFSDVKQLSTRIINTMGSTNVSHKTIADAKFFNAKIQGARIRKKPLLKEGEEQPASNSVSRQSYDSIYENFRSLNNLLLQDGNYNPSEPDVNTAGLTGKETDMADANTQVLFNTNDLAGRRILRNNRFYVGEDSLVAVARDFKKYIKGKFGVSSPEFAQIKNLKVKDYGI